MTQFNRIFQSTDPINRQELEDLLTGSFSQETEERLVNDPFAAEALVGLEEFHVAPEELSYLDNRIAQVTKGNTPFLGQFLFSLVLGFVFLATLSLISPLNRNTDIIHIDEKATTLDASEDLLLKSMELNLILPVDTMEFRKAVNEAKILPGEEIISPNPRIEYPKEALKVSEEDIRNAIPFNLESANPIGIKAVPGKKEPMSSTSSDVKVAYVQGLLIANLSRYYERKIKVRNTTVPSGTRSYSPDKTDNPNKITGPYEFIEYLDYMEFAMEPFLKGSYKTCAKRLAFLQALYPSDVNVLFYTGLCQYNLGLYEEAASRFRAATVHPIGIFREEGQWYQALAFTKLDRIEDAAWLLKDISAQGGFYAKQANAHLQALNK